jgi:hypothetical protein
VKIKSIINIVKLLRPTYYNTLTRILVFGGLALITNPIWLDILNIYLGSQKISLIGEFDWLLGLIVIILSLIYNTIHRYLDLTHENKSKPAYNNAEIKSFDEFGELCQEILPLLKDNEYIFKSTGPNSSSHNFDLLRTDLMMWEKLKVEAILPNNETIKKLIEENKKLIPSSYQGEFNKMLLHIRAFNEHIKNPNFDYSDYQFPKSFPEIIKQVSYENAKTNKSLKRKHKWISKKMNYVYIKDWFIFGSFIFYPNKANDVDLAIFIDKSKVIDINIIKEDISGIVFDFKLKFKMNLHISFFDDDNIKDYIIFSSNNPLKIQKSNG